MKAVRRIIVVLAVAVGGLAFAGSPASGGHQRADGGHQGPAGTVGLRQRAHRPRSEDRVRAAVERVSLVRHHRGERARRRHLPGLAEAQGPEMYAFRVRSRSGTTLSNKFYLNVTTPVLYSKSGVGNFTSDYFNLPSEWVVWYTADCSNTYGGQRQLRGGAPRGRHLRPSRQRHPRSPAWRTRSTAMTSAATPTSR